MTRFEFGFEKLCRLRSKYEKLLYSTRYKNSDEDDAEMFKDMIVDIRSLADELENVETTIISFSESEANYEEWLDRQKKAMETALLAAHVLKDKNYRPKKQLDTKEMLEINQRLLYFEEDGKVDDEFWS